MNKSYSVIETAKLLGYSTNSVYSFLRKGEIKATRLGKGKFRIPQEEIDRLVSSRVPPLPEAEKVVILPESESMIPTPNCLVPPRPGMSLKEMGDDKPIRTIALWFQERAGLPRLFDWFVSLTSIVLSISLFLYTKQLDSLLVGRYAIWFTPIKIALLAGGLGLILADMLKDEHPLYKKFNGIFRYILVATYLGLAFLQLPAKDIDGFVINGLFAVVILIEAFFGVLSSTAYMLYVQGLLVGMSLIVSSYASDSGLSELSMAIRKVIDGATWIFSYLTVAIIIVTLFGYFWNKKVLKIALSVSGVALMALSVYYANVGYYARSFFILITGMVGMLLPFWEDFKRRYESDRSLVYRMFGTILMAFALCVLIIGSVQTILINNGMRNLLDKTDFVKVSVESQVSGAISTLEGLTQNSVFTRAFVAKNTNDLDSFLKAVFKNNQSINNVLVADLSGKVIAVYPSSVEIGNVSFSNEPYFQQTVVSEKSYVSKQVEYFAPDIEKAIVVSTPVFDLQTKKILGVAMVTLSAEYLSDTMQRIAEGTAGQLITIIDSDGKWIVYPDTEVIGATVADADATSDLWKMDVGQTKGYDRLGRYSLFVSEKSEILSWSVVVSQPMTSALDMSNSGMILVLFMLLVSALTVVYSYVFSKNKLMTKGM